MTRIGLDLDGTVVVYDEVFHRHAVERFGMPADVLAQKGAIRSWFRACPGGEERWIELQGLVYGPMMVEAPAASGISGLLRGCRDARIGVSIISHKTELSVAKPQVDLRAAAFAWLEQHGFFEADGLGMRREDVFLEPTRVAKIARIAAERCALFVDDLEEVFAEPSFPTSVERWLYSPGSPERDEAGVHVFADWSAVLRRALELKEIARGR